MTPTVTSRRAGRFAVIVLVCGIFLPIVGATVSQVIEGPSCRILAVASPLGAVLANWPDQEEIDSVDTGFDALGAVTLARTFVPGVVPPATGAGIAPAAFEVHSSPHLPAIFRPPIG